MQYNKANYQQALNKNIDLFKDELSRTRTGKANASLLSHLMAEVYGKKTNFNEICSISVLDNSTLSVKPYDSANASAVEKAIKEANIGVGLIREGDIMKVTVPKMNEQSRKEFVKVVQRIAENYRVSIRNTRRDVLDGIAKSEKNKETSQDIAKRLKDEVEKMTQTSIEQISKLTAEKEKELMTV